MSTEVVVALIAAGGIVTAGGVGALVAYLTARRQTQTQTAAKEAEFLIARDKLLWASAEKFWNQRAANLTSQVDLERTARESAVAHLVAELALVKQDNAVLRQENLECAANLKRFEERLKRAGEQLVATMEAASSAAESATDAVAATEATKEAVSAVEAATEAAQQH